MAGGEEGRKYTVGWLRASYARSASATKLWTRTGGRKCVQTTVKSADFHERIVWYGVRCERKKTTSFSPIKYEWDNGAYDDIVTIIIICASCKSLDRAEEKSLARSVFMRPRVVLSTIINVGGRWETAAGTHCSVCAYNTVRDVVGA